jgi:hypothetical protein
MISQKKINSSSTFFFEGNNSSTNIVRDKNKKSIIPLLNGYLHPFYFFWAKTIVRSELGFILLSQPKIWASSVKTRKQRTIVI